MMRGRPRLADPTMPAHIDPRRLPKRCYWDGRDRVWYTVHKDPKPRRQRIAGAEATLADLHRLLEDLAGVQHGTVGFVCDKFHESNEFKALAERTRSDYEKERKIAAALPTKVGPLGTLVLARMTVPMVQNLIDAIARETPTKANHLLRYLRRVFAWGIRRDHCRNNPCAGVAQAKEKRERKLPDPAAVTKMLVFLQERASVALRRPGACAPYLWIAIELAFLCRLRGIEVITLTDEHALPEGVLTNRRKGSRDNIVAWTPRLRAVWDAALELRSATWERRRMPTPIHAKDRPLLVGLKGERIRKGSFDSAWQSAITRAIDEGIITPEQRFAPHGMKRRGITDTLGTRQEKQVASGHKSEAMLDVYDFSKPVVRPAGE
jgi:site-specific recombinase XerC